MAATALDEAGWQQLHTLAVEAMGTAYAPYSGYPVGVAALVDDGRTISGCNVENAAYGVGLCAECGLVSELHRGGGGRLVAVWCVDGSGRTIMPCGRCRQLMWEHGGADCRIQTPAGEQGLDQVLPQAFDATALSAAPVPGREPAAKGEA